MIGKRMRRPNIGADLLQHRKEFLRSSDSGKCDHGLSCKAFSLARFWLKMRGEDGLAPQRSDTHHVLSTRSWPDHNNGIDIRELLGQWRAQGASGHTQAI